MPNITDDFTLNAITKIVIDILEPPTSKASVNLDFNDIYNVAFNSNGLAAGVGIGNGVNMGIKAAQSVINCPILANLHTRSAKRILIQLTGGPDMTMADVTEATTMVQNHIAHEDAGMAWGVNFKAKVKNKMIVRVIATDFRKKVESYIPSLNEILNNTFNSYRAGL